MIAKTVALSIAALAIAVQTPAGSGIGSEKMQAFVAGNNEFAIDIYAELSAAEGNIFFSPYSISTALAMTYEGARTDTAAQMRETLNLALTDELIPRAFAGLEAELESGAEKGGYELSVANSLWGQEGYRFLQPFLDTLQEYYGAGMRLTDFAGDTEGARRKINAWVEDKTRKRIKDLIKPGVIDPLTRLVLCNAIYFKGDWAEQFDEEQTREQEFLNADGGKSTVAMMHKKLKCLYGESEAVQAIQLPYKGDEISMAIFLPKDPAGLPGFEASLTREQISKLLSGMRRREVQVALPRFKLEAQFSLAGTLAEMGMPLAFSDNADFSGMTGERDLYIAAVVHKAFVEVNEEGTEAAAATGVVMALRSMPRPPTVFRADHPFIFVLRDNASGSILFMGRVAQL